MREYGQLTTLEGVFVTHRAQLCRVAKKIIGCCEKAEDIVQDAYLKIIDVEAVFIVEKPEAYIFRVVRNLAIDRYRSTVRDSDIFAAEETGKNVASEAGTPEALSISRQQLDLVARAMGRLPERTRRAFEFYRVSGHTQREIAQILDVSPTLVNFMIRDALDHCRHALEP